MIAVGVDTHKRWHVVVALSALGQVLGELVIAASTAGYQDLIVWLDGLGGQVVVGIEAPAPMAPASASTSGMQESWWSKWSGRVDATDAPASPTQAGTRWRWRRNATLGRHARRSSRRLGDIPLLRGGAHAAI